MIKKIFFILLWTIPAWSAITNVQFNSGNNFSGTAPATFSSAVNAGDFLTAAVWCVDKTVTPAVSDSTNGSYTEAGCTVDSTDTNSTLCIFYFPNTASAGAGTDTVTTACGTSVGSTIMISEWTGIARTSPLDQYNGTGGYAGSPFGTNITTMVNGELIYNPLGELGNGTAGVNTAAGFTQLNGTAGNTNTDKLDQYLVQASKGLQACKFINGTSGSGTWIVNCASFEAASGASPIASQLQVSDNGGKMNIQGGKVIIQ